ncbi:uncharacterized protein LOC118277793 [Spodoptera frugiperda]|uniref:Uncharacterized protein LOC118277793 n=1 Tax=Spodoptera frugiperda TaxID=7108 RepID=A0A9R0F1Y2_SPOFR|nr:uncharacterized protein LOC118277793 [Spodoptera frugiperda]
MPGKIKVKVLAGRNLPVMDRASDTTDAFVEIKFGSITHKTDVCRKSLNPHWNSTEWYRFEVDESELQDEPLQLRLMDHDTYSANDAIGKVVISLAPLLAREANNAKSTATPHGGAVMSGWIPVFDTMHGIRGELNVIVKVELFSDFNKYKTSSCGVQFFHCPMIPPGYRATSIHGFVEELVVNDDPEYQWIDKIRTPRASNEARQVAFIKLSNQVQRLVGLKAAELGANAVVGYQQDFDLEGEAGVVARAIGTAVSITPLPMPSQTLNMPPCTQQQLKKYLDILATDNESITEMSAYYQTHQEELQKLLSILNPNASALLDETDAIEEDESMDVQRHPSINSYAGSVSIYRDEYPHRSSLRHLSEDQTDLNKLLNRESDDSDSSGPIEKLKKIKTNFFTKRFSRRSAGKQSSSSDKQEDTISLRSNASDSSRISLGDIKHELRKLSLKKPKFRKPFVNKEDEGEGMASILARSIIHVQTSLACIAETQDSEASPGSTLRRTSESEPALNISDDEKVKAKENDGPTEEQKKMPEIRFTSLSNINSDQVIPPRERKISESCPATPMPERNENLLTLPGEPGYYGSVSSALSAESSEIESSSDEEDDDESSDLKTDTERSIETTSSIVQSVLSHDINPKLIASMDKKLNILESSPDLTETKPVEIKKEIDKKTEVEQQVFDNQVLIDKCKSLESVPREVESKIVVEKPVRSNEASTSSVKDATCVTKPSSHHIKFHNPFSHKKPAKSISEPSSPVDKGSFVHRSSRRIRRQLSKLSKSPMIKSISHYSLHPKKKENKTPLSQPGSSSDVRSKAPSETVLGSPFLSYNDLMSLDKDSIDTNKFFHKSDEFDHVKVSMYIGSEPVSRSSLSGISSLYHKEEPHHHTEKKQSLKPTGLVHTAMETILLDKVQSLLLPTSPDSESVKNKQFFDDVNEKLGKVEEYRNNNNSSYGSSINMAPSSRPKSQSPPVNTRPVVVGGIKKVDKGHEHKNKPPSLVQTAMETMLMDRVQSVLIPSTPETPHPEIVFEGNDRTETGEGSKMKVKKPIAYIQSLLSPKSPDHTSPTEKFFDSKPKKKESMSTGLVHTAMETMLMEKVQSVLGPETPEPVSSVFDDYDRAQRPEDFKKREEKPHGLVQTAVETMLLERVQASALGGIVPDPVIPTDDKLHESDRNESSSGLTHTAVGTILMDKVQTLVGQPGVVFAVPLHTADTDSDKFKKSSKDDLRPTGLVHTAVETMLLDRMQASALGAPVPQPVVPAEEDQDRISVDTNKKEEVGGLTHTAMETILMDKVQSLVGQPGITFVEPKTFSDDELEEASHRNDDLKSPSLVKNVVKNILLDKVHTLAEEKEVAVEKMKEIFDKSHSRENLKPEGLIHTAFETVLLDKVQTLIPTEPDTSENKKEDEKINEDKSEIDAAIKPKVIQSEADKSTTQKETIKQIEKSKSVPEAKKNKKLTRQNSVESITETDTPKMSKPANISPSDVTKPVIVSHPQLGALETIPSLPETSVDEVEQVDQIYQVDGVDQIYQVDGVDETNNSVCDNSHAVCDINRSERDRDRREDKCDKDRGSPRHARHESYGGREPAQASHAQNSSLNATSTPLGIHRRSSDSDLSVTPKGGSLNTSAGNVGSGGGAILRPSMNSNNLDMLEYPFLTMTEYPPGFIVHIGGTVCARSVKLADGGEGAARAAWWAELRTELRAHARALRCNAVIAYTENTAICEDVCVLSASGTAVVINLDCDFNAEPEPTSAPAVPGARSAEESECEWCSVAHVPYSPGAGPYRAELAVCGGCRRARVPTVLLATCAKPSKLVSHAKAITLTAVAARVRRAPPTSEPGARDISDQLPFLEYELHKLLLAKLRMQGANAIFSLQTQIAIGERCVMALASGTACRLAALPPPTPPRIKASENDKDALEIQKALWDSFAANRLANGFDVGVPEQSSGGALPELEGEEAPALDLCADKDACVLELDEAEDVETARALAKRHVNMQVYTHGLKPVIGAPPQAFAQVWRGRLTLGGGGGSACVERHVRRALDGVAYKLRRLLPAALVAPRFQLELPEDEIQLIVSGAAIPLQDPNNPETNTVENGHPSSHSSHGSHGSHGNGNGDADDDIFELDEEQLVKSPPELPEEKSSINGQVPTTVSLTTLSHISGSRISRRLCALRLLFVRETTAVRELGGLSGFLHTFTCEVMAIVRAYTAALGGNALTSFYITQLMLQDNAHKNQGQCLLSVGGDIVHITY